MKGNINVKTENIFPIIKKFLYSDHEIFLREIVANAVDATQKLKTLASLGQFKEELGDLTIDVKIDKKKKTLSVIDRGIGMTQDEVDKYINQIAFSGAEEFVEKLNNEYEDGLDYYINTFGESETAEIINSYNLADQEALGLQLLDDEGRGYFLDSYSGSEDFQTSTYRNQKYEFYFYRIN